MKCDWTARGEATALYVELYRYPLFLIEKRADCESLPRIRLSHGINYQTRWQVMIDDTRRDEMEEFVSGSL